jgi:hypothetical protein
MWGRDVKIQDLTPWPVVATLQGLHASGMRINLAKIPTHRGPHDLKNNSDNHKRLSFFVA